jgi:phage terminase large subunit-like protein
MDIPQQTIGRLCRLSEDERRQFVLKMAPEEALRLDSMFATWAAEGQTAPPGEWRVWLMMAGRGFGKTRAGAEWVNAMALGGRRRIALVGATIDEARAVMVEGKSGILSVARRLDVQVKWEPSLNRLRWISGSEAVLFSGDNADGLRGPEHDYAWCDELAKWRQADAAWDNLQMGLRSGVSPRVLVTTTPKPMRLLERIRKLPGTVETGGRTRDNLSLPRRFVEEMTETYGGSRIGRQELEGELLSEAEGSLFPRELLERCRVQALSHPPPTFHRRGRADGAWKSAPPLPRAGGEFDRIVVGVDPCVSGNGDACGIVVAGRRDGELFVLADRSVEAGAPERWARAVALAVAEWGASHVVAEANQGGAMVESVLKAADSGLNVRLVHALKGKVARAEPVAVRFETGKAFLAGTFPELEAELSGFTYRGYDGAGSPDRADAMVWALTELSDTRSGVPRVRMI